MKKSHLALAISTALCSTSLLAVDNTNNNNKVSYAITAPQQQQLIKKTGNNKVLAQKRLVQLADIQSKVKNRLDKAGIKVDKQLKNLAAISFADLSKQQANDSRKYRLSGGI